MLIDFSIYIQDPVRIKFRLYLLESLKLWRRGLSCGLVSRGLHFWLPSIPTVSLFGCVFLWMCISLDVYLFGLDVGLYISLDVYLLGCVSLWMCIPLVVSLWLKTSDCGSNIIFSLVDMATPTLIWLEITNLVAVYRNCFVSRIVAFLLNPSLGLAPPECKQWQNLKSGQQPGRFYRYI